MIEWVDDELQSSTPTTKTLILFPMRKYYLLFFLLFFFDNAYTQKEASNWQFGHKHAAFQFHFNDSLEISQDSTGFIIYQTSASISDSLGNLLFYTNGFSIINTEHELMENGDSINYGYYWEDFQGGQGGGALSRTIH